MTRILTYKYRIKDRSAKKTLARMAYGVNQVWNYCCAQQRDVEARYKAGAPKRKWATHFDLSALCKGVGLDLNIYQDTVDGVCKVFAQSRDATRHATKFRASFGNNRALGWIPFRRCKIEGNSLHYRGNNFRFFGNKSRPLPESTHTGTIAEDGCGKWWVCFSVDVEKAASSPGVDAVGIDLGLKYLATLSDGQKIEAPQHFRRSEISLATAQRAGNARRAKAIHAKIKNQRADFIHKLSTSLAREHAFIAAGDVNAKRLAKTRMAKSVLDAGWSTLRTQLAYKASRYVCVDEKLTTQTCSECGALPASRPKGIAGLAIRFWDCSDCGSRHDRDVNAARNILRIGLSAQAHADGSRGLAQ